MLDCVGRRDENWVQREERIETDGRDSPSLPDTSWGIRAFPLTARNSPCKRQAQMTKGNIDPLLNCLLNEVA
jgi:hypothetical protein